ncbi:MAG: hypothetical protein ACK5O2_15125 [Microthrixaceae bacterium]
MTVHRGAAGTAVAMLVALVLLVILYAVPGPAVGAMPRPVSADPLVAPPTSLSADGRSATDGTRTLTVSQVLGLDPAGQAIRVTGSGYDTNKGVYIALCVIPPTDVAPSPCGGGVDMEGTAGAAKWISDNPPPYAVGLTQPYGPGGTFDASFAVNPTISPTIDCRTVRCVVVTRNDHTRGSDRSQDIFVPVAFASPVAPPPMPAPAAPQPTGPGNPAVPAAPGPTPTVPGAQGGTAPSTTSAPPSTIATTTTVAAPSATVADDGLSVSDGTRTLAASATGDLDPDGVEVQVEASGLDPTRGVFVSLCAVHDETGAPGPCASGQGRSGWFTDNPPEWADGRAEPFEAGGFSVPLDLVAVVDSETDCREVDCVIAVRADDSEGSDRSLDLMLPVSFRDEGEPATGSRSATGEGEQGAAPTAGDGGAGGSGVPAGVAAAAVVILALIAAGVAVTRLTRRRRAEAGTEPVEVPTEVAEVATESATEVGTEP